MENEQLNYVVISIILLGSISIVVLLNYCLIFTYRKCNETMAINRIYKSLIYEDESLNTECPICLEENSRNTIVLNCRHEFHKKCITTWIKTSINNNQHAKCPICNKFIVRII